MTIPQAPHKSVAAARPVDWSRRRWRSGVHLLLVSFAILVVGALYFRHQVADSRAMLARQLEVVADFKAQEILGWRSERLSAAEQIMLNPFAGDQVTALLAHPADAPLRTRVLTWLADIRDHQQGLRAMLLDPSMRLQLAYPVDDNFLGPIASEYAQGAYRQNRVRLSDLHLSKRTGRPHLDLAIPIRAIPIRAIPIRAIPIRGVSADRTDRAPSDQAVVAVLLVELDPYRFMYPDIQRWPSPSPTAECQLIRRDANSVLTVNDLRHERNAALRQQIPLAQSTSVAVRAVRGETGMLCGLDYRQVPVLAHSRSVPGTNWLILAKVDEAEADQEVLAQGLTTGAMAVLAIVIAALFLNLTRRSRESAWVRRQFELEAEHRLILNCLAEGVMGLDRAGEIVFANPAASRMLDYPLSELIGHFGHEMWHDHGPGGTRFSRAECPILRAIRTREAFESLSDTFYRRDGSPLPVEYIATPNADCEQRVALVLIFRDVSERHAADEQHRVLFEQSREALMTLSPKDGRFTSCNPSTLAMFGVDSVSDFKALGPWQLSPDLQSDGQPSEDKALAMVDLALRDGMNSFQWLHRRMDGSVFPAEVCLSTFQISGETHVQATVRDVSERHRIERQRDRAFARQERVNLLQRRLLEERPLHDKLQEIVNDVVAEFGYDVCGIWTVNEHHVCDLARCSWRDSQAARRCPGEDGCMRLAAAAGIANSWQTAILERMPFERNRYRSSDCVQVRDLLAVRHVESASEFGSLKGTEDVACSGYPLRLPGGEVMGVLAVFARETLPRDDSAILETVAHATSQAIHNARVAESLQASQKHAQREALKLRTMIEGMAEGVVVADAHDVITDVNAWFLEKTQLDRDAIVGKSLWDFHPLAAGTERVRAAIDDFRHGRRTDTYVAHRDLLGMHLAFRAQRIFSNDTYRGIILNVIDVSDIERAREAAVSADRAKSQFLANMSHEIRTPMTAILGFTDILLEQIEGPDALETAQTIRRNGEQLLALMQNVLDISQIESGRLGVELEVWPPRQIVADVGALMSVRAAAKGLTLTVDHDERLPPFITTDPIRLRQILTNLVGNAIKFTNQGSVCLSTQVLPSEDGTTSICFHVTDTGIGIDANDLERIFEAFTQVDASASRRYEGTGLGLAISKQLASALGGELTVRSTPGLGSTFTLTLQNGVTPYRESPTLEEHGVQPRQVTSVNPPLVPPDSTEAHVAAGPAEAIG